MATIGYRKAGSPQTSIGTIRAVLVQGGPPVASYSRVAVYGVWPDPLTITPDALTVVWSLYLTDDGAGLVSAGRAYLSWAANGLPKKMKIAVYTTEGALVGSSDEIVEPDSANGGKWVDFTFSTPVALNYGTAYVFAVWGNGGVSGFGDRLAVYDDEYWDPMPAAPGPSGSAGGPLFTGGGML